MTKRDKLEIVRRFKDGETIWEIAFSDWGKKRPYGPLNNAYERIIRDYVNGDLKPCPSNQSASSRDN